LVKSAVALIIKTRINMSKMKKSFLMDIDRLLLQGTKILLGVDKA